MNAADRAAALTTARFLRVAASARPLSLAFTVVAAVAIVFTNANRVAAAVAIALGVVELYYAIRIGMDAALFDDLANDRVALEDLDGALGALFRKRTSGRSLPDRCRGAVRLAVWSILTTTAQAAALIAAGVLRS